MEWVPYYDFLEIDNLMIQFDNISQELPYQVFKEKYENSLNANQKNIEAICISSYSSKNNEVNDLGLYVEGRGYINRFNTDKIVLKKSKKIKDLDRGEDKEKIIS